MEQAQDKIVSMEDDIDSKFTRTDDLKAQFDQEKLKMAKIKKFLQVYKNGLSKQITYQSMNHDKMKNKILQNEIYNRLNDIEKKLI